MGKLSAKKKRVGRGKAREGFRKEHQTNAVSWRFQVIGADGSRRNIPDVSSFVIGLGGTELEMKFSPSARPVLRKNGELMIEVTSEGGFLTIGHGCGNFVLLRTAAKKPRVLV